MVAVIGITQFVFLSLGVMALNILIKVGTAKPSEHPPLALFLAHNGLWLFLVPLAWVILAALFTQTNKPALVAICRVSGILLAAAILVAYGYVIFFVEG